VRWRGRSACILAVGAALFATGCGGSGNDDTTSPSSYLLTQDEITRQANGTSDPAAARTVLEFWRAVQFQDFALSYSYLATPLRRQVPYSVYLSKLGEARGLFLSRPRIYDISQGDDFTTVDIAALQGDILTPADQIIGFATVQEGDRTRISSDVFNLFHRSYRPDVH
jgi:hypothetical protein